MIDPSTQLAAMIRAQFAAQFRAQAKSSSERGGVADRQAALRDAAAGTPGRKVDGQGGGSPAHSNAQAPASSKDAESARLQQLVALRVRALSPDDPQRERKAFRLFLESVLVQAFGRDRLDDRGFDQMIDTVLHRMEGDAELHAALREAGGLLLSEAQPVPKAPSGR
ncbi:hypothetical protein ACEN9J_11310 [Variovorax sp. Varisp41]|uniref:hypothetical protein n=1 Tax=unclassified Variovorax TaxID=663243 RepID=UPI0039B4B7CA